MTDPLIPPWEMCKTCGGDHWTKDHPSLAALLAEASKFVMEEYNGPLARWFDHGRIRIMGPWQFRDGIKWQAIADPYNATGRGFDREIEGVGATPEEALQELIRKFHEQEVNLEQERDEASVEIERLHLEIEVGYNEAAQLRRAAERGRLVILYATAGEHLVPVYDELVHDASVSVDNDFLDVTVMGGASKEYLVGPSTITIRVTR
jgi:hypothetical protein